MCRMRSLYFKSETERRIAFLPSSQATYRDTEGELQKQIFKKAGVTNTYKNKSAVFGMQ